MKKYIPFGQLVLTMFNQYFLNNGANNLYSTDKLKNNNTKALYREKYIYPWHISNLLNPFENAPTPPRIAKDQLQSIKSKKMQKKVAAFCCLEKADASLS